MTAHTNESNVPAARRRRPRWLLPGIVAAVLAIALVVGGILPATFVLYVFSMGAMLLMHAGGHGGHGSGHADHTGHGVQDGDCSPVEAGNEGRKGGGCH